MMFMEPMTDRQFGMEDVILKRAVVSRDGGTITKRMETLGIRMTKVTLGQKQEMVVFGTSRTLIGQLI